MPVSSPRPPAVDRLLVMADRWAAAGRPAMADAARRAAQAAHAAPADRREPAHRPRPDDADDR